MIRQVWLNGKWIEGLPTEYGQRYRFMTPAGYQYGIYSPEPEPEVVDMRITKRCFLDRLLPKEEVDIDLASIGDTPEAAAVRRFMRRIDMSPFVDLSLQQTADGLHMVEQAGLIAQGRANEILTDPIKEHERYRG